MEQITGSAPSIIPAVCLAITASGTANTAADTSATIEQQSRQNIIEQSHQFFMTKNKKNK